MSDTSINKCANASVQTTNAGRFRQPRYSVEEVDGGYDVRVHLPGVRKTDAKITFHQDSLLLEATPVASAGPNWKSRYREIPESDFRLRLDLNVAVDVDQAKARTADGVLTLHLPLADEAKPKVISVE